MDLANAPIRLQEPLIVERLRLAFPAHLFQLDRVPQILTLKEFERLAKLTPFIGLAWTGMELDPANQRLLKGWMTWSLMLLVRSSNGLETRFKGDAMEIGLDAMIDVATVLLQGAPIGESGSSTVTGVRSAIADGWSDDNIALAQIDFKVSFASKAANFNLTTPGQFSVLGITWAADGLEIPQTETQPEE